MYIKKEEEENKETIRENHIINTLHQMYRPYKFLNALDDLRWDSASNNLLLQNHVSTKPSNSPDNNETLDY